MTPDSWYGRLIANTPLANLFFLIVIVVGIVAYLSMPRARDPEINFNWVNILTAYPGATAGDVEREITAPLEDALRTVSDIRFVTSSSREGTSSILIRFERIDNRTFDKRVTDVRREVLNKAAAELPAEALTPRFTEITTSNGFPTGMIALYGPVAGEVMRAQAFAMKRDMERVRGIDRLLTFGFQEPEIHIDFDPFTLATRGIAASSLADQIGAWFRDVVAGRFMVNEREWLARARGRTDDPEAVAHLPVVIEGRAITLQELATISLSAERPDHLVRYRGQPAVLLSISKKADANTLDLMAQLQAFVDERNSILAPLGLQLMLTDDQTHETRQTISVMETNALLGFAMVLVLVGLFLGWRLGILVALGLPFALSGAFAVITAEGSTLNLTVLLGVVIALGMLVDDAVVIVEAIHDKITQGLSTQEAIFIGVLEVGAPVFTAMLTTVAAFLPLMLLPGILGEFLKIVPMVVTVALVISLLEAYWLLPAHILALRHTFDTPRSRLAHWRERMIMRLRNQYGRLLVRVLRRPWRWALLVVTTFILAGALVVSGAVRTQFFAFDSIRLFYIHLDMPVGSSLKQTLHEAERATAIVERLLPPEELRSAVATAGIKFTDTEPLYGDHYGQVSISLHPRAANGRDVEAIIDSLRTEIMSLTGPAKPAFLAIKGGPPAQRPINVKVKSEDQAQLDAAVSAVRSLLSAMPGIRDITDDRSEGRPTVTFRLDRDAIARAGMDAAQVLRTIRLLGEGERVGKTRREGEALDIIVRAQPTSMTDPAEWLRLPMVASDGRTITLGELVRAEFAPSQGFIRRYQFVRAVTVEAEIDSTLTETMQANAQLLAGWQQIAANYPAVKLDFTGELDDIRESLDAMKRIFALGIALIYLILATQFRSYLQPLIVLITMPLALSGVIFGLFLSGLPLSLYTLYGVIALTGIAVNSAIVLVAAANDRIATGMSALHATLYASRRRLVPILITSSTTIAGLFSLAVGLGGKSLLWGPVASSIVWGLGFSTVLTLLATPLLLRITLTQRQPQQIPVSQ